jgi:hypothetical protein
VTVAIVIPTIDGREPDLARCLKAYKRTAPRARVYIEHGHGSCGQAWIAGAAKATADGFDYLHLTADDLEPHPGWLKTAVQTVDRGLIPAPLVHHPDGSLESAGLNGITLNGAVGDDWQPVESTTVPFLTRAMWEQIGMIPIHYATDLWVSAVGRRRGYETVIRTPMRFTHYTAPAGRNQARAPGDVNEFRRLLAQVP